MFYRITRNDGGFDTGLKSLRERITEDLPLVENNYNYFKFQIFDAFNNAVETNAAPIAIAQGKFSIDGQSLSHDICLEIDDLDNDTTKLELIFQKNSTLPLKKRLTKIVSKNISDETGEWLVIKVLEGVNYALPSSNKPIGQMIIKREELNRDVVKGADVDLTFEISESKELTIFAYIPMTDQTFRQIYVQDLRDVIPKQLSSEVAMLNYQIKEEIKTAEKNNESETVKALVALEKEAEKLFEASTKLVNDDTSDAKFQIEDSKRQIAQKVDEATKDKRLSKAKTDYATQKEECLAVLESDGNDDEKKAFAETVNQEPIFINSPNHLRIEERAKSLSRLKYGVLWRTPKFLLEMFNRLEGISHTLDKSDIAAGLVFAGNQARENENWEKLREINNKIIDLLPETEQEKHVGIVGIF
ncbi:MAG: hypothetical protein H7Z37_08050 [Pyrinomonadaceae bacterium]|nr:hypothetical protein [Pyrinomonadaceae bacterium]